MIICLDGALLDTKKNKTYKPEDVFGSKYLIKKNEKKRFKAEIVVKKTGSFGEISYVKLLKILGGSLEQVIERNKDNHENKRNKNNEELMSYAKSIHMEQLIYVRKLGQGQFGKVSLVVRK
jgi:cGMP-dependent protein kinase